MSEELKSVESEEIEEIVEQDSSDVAEDLVEVGLDEILEYAFDQGIEADKVDEWIAENFITEEDDEEEDDEEEVEEGKTSKASVKKEEDDEEEGDDEEEVAEQEEGEEEEGDEEEEVPVDEKKMSSKAKAAAAKYRKSSAGKKAIAKSKKKRSRPGYKVDKARAKKMAKSRKMGGISSSFEVPGTKNQMLKNIYDQVNGMLKADLASKYEQIMSSTSLEEVTEEEVKEETRVKAVAAEDISPVNVEDDVNALMANEEGLSDDFKQKASTIFEAAVHAKVVDELNARMEDQAKEQEAGSQEFQKELTEKVDGYLTYVVEEWMKENELAIERGIRSELVEDFMSGLRTLFSEHYIDIPEEKVDMVDDLFTKVEDLESSLDEEINRGVELQKELAQFKKEDALTQATKDLADTDSEKIAKLAEGIEFENTEQYIEKLNVLKESYFPKADSVTSEITETDENIEVSEEQSPEKLDESMKHYTSAIRRYNS
jgi:hypothetical protein